MVCIDIFKKYNQSLKKIIDRKIEVSEYEIIKTFAQIVTKPFARAYNLLRKKTNYQSLYSLRSRQTGFYICQTLQLRGNKESVARNLLIIRVHCSSSRV